jgi:AcrR family transcriptional regulator
VVASPDRQRNPLRTRSAILDAAATLFAERGYGATSLADVGARAGVSRGAPGYCFGSKADLYRAVLERAIDDVRAAVRSGRERSLASGRSSDDILAGAIGEYFDYLHAHPVFVRLIERSALGGEALPDGLRPAIHAGQEAVAAIAEAAGLDPAPGSDASQLLLTMVSLCWFPVVHRHTVAPAIGVDLESSAGIHRRREHIMAFVHGGMRSLAEAGGLSHTGGG